MKKSGSHFKTSRDLRTLFLKSMAFFIVLVVVVTSLSIEAEARRRRKSRSKQKQAKVINEPKLYERMGGAKGMSDIVDEWVRLSLADGRVSSTFVQTTTEPERLVKLRKALNDQLCELADGPCQYKGKDMQKTHASMKISEGQFLAFAENLFHSMQKFNVPEREKNEMLARIDEFRDVIVAPE